MLAPVAACSSNVGFLSVFPEGNGYVGGYLVTNPWGRPLEFRLTSAVQPNKVQQILYGETLGHFLYGELIGKTLLEKTTTQAHLVLVDHPLSLDLRLRVEMPVALWTTTPNARGIETGEHVFCHEKFPGDAEAVRGLLPQLGLRDLGEPFARIRDALQEARKMGVTQRVAA